MMRTVILSAACCSLLAACGAEPATPPAHQPSPATPATDPDEPPAANADDDSSDDGGSGDGTFDDGGFGDLVIAPGSELVVQYCIACHGPRQFLQQRGSRDTWRGLIRWMQKDHGMAALPEQIEDRIVEYLAKHYAPEATGRRRPIPPELMPPNPYER